MSRKKGGAAEHVNPNLIPMIDIMFLLLLFFMLGADMSQRELEEVPAQVQMALAHAAAGEDALGELVSLEPQAPQRLLLRDARAEVGDGQPRDARADGRAGRLGSGIERSRAGSYLACAGGAQLSQPPGLGGDGGVGGLRTKPVRPALQANKTSDIRGSPAGAGRLRPAQAPSAAANSSVWRATPARSAGPSMRVSICSVGRRATFSSATIPSSSAP